MEQNYYYYKKENDSNENSVKQAKSSLRLGLLSLTFFCMFFNLILSLISIVKGIRYLGKHRKEGRLMAITGIAASVLSVVMFFAGWSIVMRNEAFMQAMTEYMTDSGAYSLDSDTDPFAYEYENEGEEL